MDFSINYIVDKPYEFRIEFNKILSKESIKTLNDTLEISLTKLEKAEFESQLTEIQDK